MKNVILIVGIFLSGVGASASEQMVDEIVCNRVQAPGTADNGLTVILKSNDISWVKLVQIYENGYLGPRLIANIQVPLQPKLVGVPGNSSEIDMVYEGEEATLSVRSFKHPVSDPRILTGDGSIDLRLPGYAKEEVPLECTYAQE